VDFAIGACQLFRRSAWEEVGGIDESYFYGPEDVDFCLRLRRRNFRIVQVADALCDHPPRRRNRRLLTIRGLRHAGAVTRYLIRRRFWPNS
jgi:GT2 family glycosyltransferase